MITFNANKILIPIDFSETAKRAIKHGASLAKLFNSEIILLHVQKKNNLVEVVFPAMKIEGTLMIQDFLEGKMEKIAQKKDRLRSFLCFERYDLGEVVCLF